MTKTENLGDLFIRDMTKKYIMKTGHWFHCKCGKFHFANFVNKKSVCICGRKLKKQILNKSTIEKEKNYGK